jgi:hypothetical protein
MTPGSARDHFGGDPSKEPGCLLKVEHGDERGILMALRRKEDEIESLERALAETENDAYLYFVQSSTIKTLFGSSGLRMGYDALEGRAMAAEAMLAVLTRWRPDLAAAAQRQVCLQEEPATTPKNEFKCGHCDYRGPCYGTPVGDRVSAPWCKQCGRNDRLERCS